MNDILIRLGVRHFVYLNKKVNIDFVFQYGVCFCAPDLRFIFTKYFGFALYKLQQNVLLK